MWTFDGLRMIDSRLADGGNTLVGEPPDQGLCAGNGFVLGKTGNGPNSQCPQALSNLSFLDRLFRRMRNRACKEQVKNRGRALR